MATPKKPNGSDPVELVNAAGRLRDATVQMGAARHAFTAAFREYVAAAPSIGAARFWDIIDEYRDQVAQRLQGQRHPTNAVWGAAREVARLAYTAGGVFATAANPLATLAAFVREYAARVGLLGGCFDWHGDALALDRSDDAYSDLLDALPLAGRTVFRRIELKKVKTAAELSRAVRGAVPEPRLVHLILHGEHSHDRCIERSLRHYVELHMRDVIRAAAEDENGGGSV